MKQIDVLVGRTWLAGNPCLDHYRLYGTKRINASGRERTMIFDGMDGVVISDAPSTKVSGCWEDIEAQPAIIESLVGPKGLAFLQLLKKVRVRAKYVTTPVRGRKKKTEVLFKKVRIVSAWQFNVIDGSGTEKLILGAIKKHLKIIPRKQKWILE